MTFGRRRAATFATLTLSFSLLAGCGSSDDQGLDTAAAVEPSTPAATASPTSTPSATPTPAPSTARDPRIVENKYVAVTVGSFARDPVAEAVVAYYTAKIRAMHEGKPNLRALRRVTTSARHRQELDAVAWFRDNGVVPVLPRRWTIKALATNGSKATVRICSPTHHGLKKARTGAWVTPEWVTKKVEPLTYTLTRQRGRWLLSRSRDDSFSCRGVS